MGCRTRQPVPLVGVPQHCLPAADSSQTRSRQLLEKAFDKGIFCSNEYYSSITPRLLHVSDSFVPVLDQYTGDRSPSFIQVTGHQLVSLANFSQNRSTDLLEMVFHEGLPLLTIILKFPINYFVFVIHVFLFSINTPEIFRLPTFRPRGITWC